MMKTSMVLTVVMIGLVTLGVACEDDAEDDAPPPAPTATPTPTATSTPEPTPTPLPMSTPVRLPGRAEGHPVDLQDYASLISRLQPALENRDAMLLQQLFRVGERPELMIGGWGLCGAGVGVAPMDQENLDAILGGSPIIPVAIGKRDYGRCGNAAYGVITTGWAGKVLPHTYSGEAGPSSGFFEWEFGDVDTVMLVFWSAQSCQDGCPAELAFYGLAPAGSFPGGNFTRISDLPGR